MSVQLNTTASAYFNQMGLPSTDAALVKIAVTRYAAPTTFCSALTWIMWRVVNAVKAAWGWITATACSDWQKAVEATQFCTVQTFRAFTGIPQSVLLHLLPTNTIADSQLETLIAMQSGNRNVAAVTLSDLNEFVGVILQKAMPLFSSLFNHLNHPMASARSARPDQEGRFGPDTPNPFRST